MNVRTVAANGIEIANESFGDPGGRPLLLIMGLGTQMLAWHVDFCQQLVERGFFVVRFDNRDTGLSTHLNDAPLPNVLASLSGDTSSASYTLDDMADDVAGLLDGLGLDDAHLVGASMGGMIAQHLAARQPHRLRSLALMMTTSGSRRLPQPSLHVRRALVSRPAGRDTAAVVAHLQRVLGVIGSPAFPADPEQLRHGLEALVRRAWRPAGTARQIAAVVADGDRSALLQLIVAPTRVIHGAADPLVPAAAGHDLAARISGAVADIIPGMGHDLPWQLLPRYADGITENAARAA